MVSFLPLWCSFVLGPHTWSRFCSWRSQRLFWLRSVRRYHSVVLSISGPRRVLDPNTLDFLDLQLPGGLAPRGWHLSPEIVRSADSIQFDVDSVLIKLLLQTTANYIVSQLAVWDVDYPGGVGNDNIKWRALIWVISEGLLLLAVAINYLPPRVYSLVFRASIVIMMLDFFLCVIWLPIGVSKTYGFRSAHDVFLQTGTVYILHWILECKFS